MSAFVSFQTELGYQFRDPQLLRLALTHPSVVHEPGIAGGQHNQRLEFLGDAVLQLALTRALYDKFPTLEEGPLTKARARMVNRRSLAEKGRRLHLGQHLILSRGEEQNGGRERASALADAFEAVVGAVFLDGGFEVAGEFIRHRFREFLSEIDLAPGLDNPKGELQELLQAESPEAPEYHLHSASGPDHDREFECTVHFRGAEIGRGKGKSKKAAESQAAIAALFGLRAG